MSDFLTRMAQVSRGEAAVITPRVPSLFAPTEVPGDSEIDMPVVLQPREAKTGPDIKAASDSTGSGQASRKVGPAASSERPIVTEPTGRHQEQPVPLVASKQDDAAVPNIAGTLSMESHQAATSPQHTFVNEERALPLTEMRQTVAPDIAFNPAFNGSGHAMPQSFSPLVPSHNVQQVVPPQMAELPGATDEHSNQAPTIHINIGRVEVRAQTPVPAAAPRPVRSKPRSNLSLNDYLKRGGRS